MPDAQPNKLYYGWKIVFALLVILTFSSGLSFYNHSVYLNALATQSSFSVSSASMAVSVFFLSSGVAGLIVGRMIQRVDTRISFTVGAILCCVALTALAHVQALWQLIIVYMIFGSGFASSALLPATTLITRWFRKRRAMALSIASTGLSLGGVVITPVSVLMVESLGFSTAAPLMGLMYLIGVIPVAWIWLRPEPASLGLRIDGVKSVPQDGQESGPDSVERVDAAENGMSLAQARKLWLFWGICIGYVFLMLAQVGGIAHQYGLAREMLSEAQTALAVAILPIASIIGRLIGGWLVEQMSIRRFAIIVMIMQAVALSLLSGGFNPVSLCLGLFLFGSSVGNLLMLQPLLLAEAFGVQDYARIFSVSNLMSSWGTAAGPALMGVVYAASGMQYALPYLVAALAGLLGLCLFVSAGRLSTQQSHS
jgi:MFS family permease